MANSFDPSEESLPEDRRPGMDPTGPVRRILPIPPGRGGFGTVGLASGLGPLSPAPMPLQTVRMGSPFSERFDRAIDEILSPTQAGGAGGTASIEHPFQITHLAAGTSALQINVRYGTLNDIVPTDVGVDLDLDLGDGTYTLYLDVEVLEDAVATIVTVSLIYDLSPQPADDDDHAYITLGQVIVAGGVITTINQAVTHSLRFAACNRVEADPEADPPIAFERGTYEFWGV